MILLGYIRIGCILIYVKHPSIYLINIVIKC